MLALDQQKLAGWLVQHCTELQLIQDCVWQEVVTDSGTGYHLELPLMVTGKDFGRRLVKRPPILQWSDEVRDQGVQQRGLVVT